VIFAWIAKQIYRPIFIISVFVPSGVVTLMICNILTIAVYSYVKKLRNTLGKCVISCLLSMVMIQLYWILIVSGLWMVLPDFGMLLNEYLVRFPLFCKLLVFSVIYPALFFYSAHVVWLSVTSYHLWQTFKTLRRDDHRYQFLVYSAVVWITAAGTVVLDFNDLNILVFGLGNFT